MTLATSRRRFTSWNDAGSVVPPVGSHRETRGSALLDGLHDDLDAPVLLAPGRRAVVAHGTALPEARRRDDLVRHAARHEVVAHRLCAPLRQLDVRRLAALRI